MTAPDGARPAGEPLAARDAYGSRFLLAVPFGYGDGEPDHWYAWDIDQCWIDVVEAAGTFESAAGALADWRDAAGAPATGAELEPCPPALLPPLLRPCLETGPMSDMLQGTEPRELIREFYRMRRRARALVWPADVPAGEPFDATAAVAEFRSWYAARHDHVPADLGETVGTPTAGQEPPKNSSTWSGRASRPTPTASAATPPPGDEASGRLLRQGVPDALDQAIAELASFPR